MTTLLCKNNLFQSSYEGNICRGKLKRLNFSHWHPFYLIVAFKGKITSQIFSEVTQQTYSLGAIIITALSNKTAHFYKY